MKLEKGCILFSLFLKIMFLHIHIPIIDCRGLLAFFKRLPKPLFPESRAGSYVRNFGEVRFRKSVPLTYYVGEDQYFLADGALRFEDLPRYNIPIGNSRYNNFCEFRRLYTLGRMMNRYEFGFSFYSGASDVDTVLRYILRLRVKVKDAHGKYTSVALADAGNRLPQIYDSSTADRPGEKVAGRVSCGDILCVVELNPNDKTSLPASAEEPVLEFKKEKVSLHHYISHDRNHKQNSHCWIVRKYSESSDSLFASKLRNALFRIHLEAQALFRSYEFLILNANSDALKKQALLEHIKDIQHRLLKRSRFDICPEKIVNIALRANHAIDPMQMQKMLFMVGEIKNEYMTADFLQLMVPLNLGEWCEQIELELQKNWNPKEKSDLEYLKELCSSNNYRKFAQFLAKHKGELWEIAKSVITGKLKELVKMKGE